MPQEKINSFAEVTEDMQWIHIDSKRAEIESPYKKTVAHGFLMLSMISKIIFDGPKNELDLTLEASAADELAENFIIKLTL